MRYLLDSTLLIDHAHGDSAAGTLLRRLVEEGHDLYTCDVVTCEVLARGDEEQVRHLTVLLNALEYVAIAPPAARWAGESRRSRHAAGGRRSLGDALIAGLALDLDAIVVTRNRPDFERQGVRVLAYLGRSTYQGAAPSRSRRARNARAAPVNRWCRDRGSGRAPTARAPASLAGIPSVRHDPVAGGRALRLNQKGTTWTTTDSMTP